MSGVKVRTTHRMTADTLKTIIKFGAGLKKKKKKGKRGKKKVRCRILLFSFDISD